MGRNQSLDHRCNSAVTANSASVWDMHRRSVRLRREYLYRKSLEGKQKDEYEKKRIVRQALQEGKPIPTHLREESAKLKKDAELDDDNTAVQRTHIDDEYSNLGVQDPKACPSVLCHHQHSGKCGNVVPTAECP